MEDFFSGVQVLDVQGNVVLSSVNSYNLDGLPDHGSGLYMSTDIEEGKKGFLRGHSPSKSSLKAYTFVAPKANHVVDIYYWLFTPFNEGKETPVGVVGDHVGDWERMTVRTVKGVATQVEYHAHSDSGSGVFPWAQASKVDNQEQLVGYIAKGSHGFWAAAGAFTYAVIPEYQLTLQDETGNGVAWDLQDDLVVYKYPDMYAGSDGWLNFQGRWGNQGNIDCWWYSQSHECQVVDGPFGPNRVEMAGPLMQTLGTVSTTGRSTFDFYVDDSSNKSGIGHVVMIRQQCSSLSEENGTDDPSTKVESVVNVTASTPFVPGKRTTLSVDACAEGSMVKSYVVGMCRDEGCEECEWGNTRALRAFSDDPSVFGFQNTSAIDVDDLDVWKW